MNGRIFLDASFWIAYRDEEEAPHPVARRAMDELARQRPHFVTTLPVICEIHAFFARDRHKRELLLVDLFNNPILEVEEVLHQDQKAALEILRSHRDKSYSLCDAISFAIMRRMKIARAVAFDVHFRQFGEFEILN